MTVSKGPAAEVDYNARTWSLVEGPARFSYHPDQGWAIDSATGTETPPRDRDDWLPQALLPFFPLSLPIWGGDGDDFRVTGAQDWGENVTLDFVHVEDPNFRGHAVINTCKGVVIEFTTPAEHIIVSEIASTNHWVP